MLIYRGKLDWGSYAVDEGIIIIFPDDIGPAYPVGACWQWTKTEDGKPNAPQFQRGTVDSVERRERESMDLSLFHGHRYCIQASTQGVGSLTITMTSDTIAERSDTKTLDLVSIPTEWMPSIPPTLLPAFRLYFGKLTYLPYAKDELFIMILPRGMATNAPVFAFWQWTTDAEGNVKANKNTIDRIKDPIGDTWAVQGPDYKLAVTIDDTKQNANVNLENSAGRVLGYTLLTLDPHFLRATEVSPKAVRALPMPAALYARRNRSDYDLTARALAGVGLALGIAGCISSVPSAYHTLRPSTAARAALSISTVIASVIYITQQRRVLFGCTIPGWFMVGDHDDRHGNITPDQAAASLSGVVISSHRDHPSKSRYLDAYIHDLRSPGTLPFPIFRSSSAENASLQVTLGFGDAGRDSEFAEWQVTSTGVRVLCLKCCRLTFMGTPSRHRWERPLAIASTTESGVLGLIAESPEFLAYWSNEHGGVWAIRGGGEGEAWDVTYTGRLSETVYFVVRDEVQVQWPRMTE